MSCRGKISKSREGGNAEENEEKEKLREKGFNRAKRVHEE
jgi:hypothetical protein